MRTIALLLIGLGTAQGVAAHDLWVQPEVFAAAVDAPVPLTIQVGHGAARQRWTVGPERVARFATFGPGGSVDRRGSLRLGTPGPDATLRFAQAGTQVIVLVSNDTTSDLPALRFNDYARDEGLTPALAARAAAGTSDTPGRELYSRRAKALVEVGSAAAGPSAATRALGLTLEIVPERDPYAPGGDAVLPVRVYYHGKPLAGALVKLNNLDFDARPVAAVRTDTAGRVRFTVPFAGLWQMNVVWTRAIKGNPAADFATVFSSLTFGTKRSSRPLETR